MPDSVKYIERHAFYDCDSLTQITLPEGAVVEYSAFQRCDSLKKVTLLGDNQIDNVTFAYCSSLTDVTVSGQTCIFGERVFYHCSELTALTFDGAAPRMDEYALVGITVSAFYPCGDDSWTEDKLSDYGGDVSWQRKHGDQNGACSVCGEGLPRVQGLTQTEAELYGFTVGWDALEGATKYWIYVDGKAYASTKTTELTVTKRSPGTDYRIAVTAMLADGTILPVKAAEEYTARTQKPTSTAFTAGTDCITLTWDTQGGSKTWIYLGTSPEQLALVASSAGSSYTVKNLAPDTGYYIRLARLVDGKVVMSQELLQVKTASDAGLRVEARLEGQTLSLDWQKYGDSYKHWVIIQTGDRTLTYSTTDTTFTYNGFDPETCTVSVRGVNANGMYDYGAVEL